ncbi:MAG: hypothetical protein BMS9Abin39_0682 [Ignavibacteria bacterium]|nr:MAG: hypothetical protein BMS9Abin39_0682 [Ignavibacteria bacterium]
MNDSKIFKIINRTMFLWSLASFLILISIWLSHALLPANEPQFSATFFTRTMMFGLLITSFTMSVIKPDRTIIWALSIGSVLFLGTVISVLIRLIFEPEKGIGNMLPFALILSLVKGYFSAFVGAYTGKLVRWLFSKIKR